MPNRSLVAIHLTFPLRLARNTCVSPSSGWRKINPATMRSPSSRLHRAVQELALPSGMRYTGMRATWPPAVNRKRSSRVLAGSKANEAVLPTLAKALFVSLFSGCRLNRPLAPGKTQTSSSTTSVVAPFPDTSPVRIVVRRGVANFSLIARVSSTTTSSRLASDASKATSSRMRASSSFLSSTSLRRSSATSRRNCIARMAWACSSVNLNLLMRFACADSPLRLRRMVSITWSITSSAFSKPSMMCSRASRLASS